MRRGDGSIKPDVLRALLMRSTDARDEQSEIAKDVHADLKQAVADHKLNMRAFNFCVSLARMKDETKRIDLWRAIESYVDILGLDEAKQVELEDAIAARRAVA